MGVLGEVPDGSWGKLGEVCLGKHHKILSKVGGQLRGNYQTGQRLRPVWSSIQKSSGWNSINSRASEAVGSSDLDGTAGSSEWKPTETKGESEASEGKATYNSEGQGFESGEQGSNMNLDQERKSGRYVWNGIREHTKYTKWMASREHDPGCEIRANHI